MNRDLQYIFPKHQQLNGNSGLTLMGSELPLYYHLKNYNRNEGNMTIVRILEI